MIGNLHMSIESVQCKTHLVRVVESEWRNIKVQIHGSDIERAADRAEIGRAHV